MINASVPRRLRRRKRPLWPITRSRATTFPLVSNLAHDTNVNAGLDRLFLEALPMTRIPTHLAFQCAHTRHLCERLGPDKAAKVATVIVYVNKLGLSFLGLLSWGDPNCVTNLKIRCVGWGVVMVQARWCHRCGCASWSRRDAASSLRHVNWWEGVRFWHGYRLHLCHLDLPWPSPFVSLDNEDNAIAAIARFLHPRRRTYPYRGYRVSVRVPVRSTLVEVRVSVLPPAISKGIMH